jgi:hypothetical protein
MRNPWIAVAAMCAGVCIAYTVVSSWPEIVRYRRMMAM